VVGEIPTCRRVESSSNKVQLSVWEDTAAARPVKKHETLRYPKPDARSNSLSFVVPAANEVNKQICDLEE
jgi:hypothetical protein